MSKQEFLQQVMKDGYYVTWDDGHKVPSGQVLEILDEQKLVVKVQFDFISFPVIAELILQYAIWSNPDNEKQIIQEHIENLKGNTRKGFGQ